MLTDLSIFNEFRDQVVTNLAWTCVGSLEELQ